MPAIRILSAENIHELVTMPDAIRLMRSAFSELSLGDAIVPQRINMEMPAENSRSLVMPAYSARTKRYSVKIVTLSSNNPLKNLPFIHGLLILFDSDTGIPLALMDAEYITALRTGAASALATGFLARRDARVVMIFGAGVQARTQLEGVASVRNVNRAMVFSPLMTESERFCSEMKSQLGLDVLAVASPQNVNEADIVCTATSSNTPVFRDEDLRPGVHINGIGSYKVSMREIPAPTVERAKIFVDSLSSALKEAGDIVMAINEGTITESHIAGELGELVLGKKKGRTDDKEVTVFKSVGNAVQDLAIATYVGQNAISKNIGIAVEL